MTGTAKNVTIKTLPEEDGAIDVRLKKCPLVVLVTVLNLPSVPFARNQLKIVA